MKNRRILNGFVLILALMCAVPAQAWSLSSWFGAKDNQKSFLFMVGAACVAAWHYCRIKAKAPAKTQVVAQSIKPLEKVVVEEPKKEPVSYEQWQRARENLRNYTQNIPAPSQAAPAVVAQVAEQAPEVMQIAPVSSEDAPRIAREALEKRNQQLEERNGQLTFEIEALRKEREEFEARQLALAAEHAQRIALLEQQASVVVRPVESSSVSKEIQRVQEDNKRQLENLLQQVKALVPASSAAANNGNSGN